MSSLRFTARVPVYDANLRVGDSAWFILQASVPAHLRREPRAEEWFRYRDLYAMGQRDLGMEPILERKRSVSRFVYFLRVPPLSFLAYPAVVC